MKSCTFILNRYETIWKQKIRASWTDFNIQFKVYKISTNFNGQLFVKIYMYLGYIYLDGEIDKKVYFWKKKLVHCNDILQILKQWSKVKLRICQRFLRTYVTNTDVTPKNWEEDCRQSVNSCHNFTWKYKINYISDLVDFKCVFIPLSTSSITLDTSFIN